MLTAGVGPSGGAGLCEVRERRHAGARGFANARILPFATRLPGNVGCAWSHLCLAWFRATKGRPQADGAGGAPGVTGTRRKLSL
jgi:hypothetical protein